MKAILLVHMDHVLLTIDILLLPWLLISDKMLLNVSIVFLSVHIYVNKVVFVSGSY